MSDNLLPSPVAKNDDKKKYGVGLLGRLLLTSVFAGAVGLAGIQLYGVYQLKQSIKSSLKFDTKLATKFSVSPKEHEAGFVKSTGSIGLSYANDCAETALDFGTLQYTITHLPFMPTKFTAYLQPSESFAKNLKLGGIKYDRSMGNRGADEHPLYIEGEIGSDGKLTATGKTPKIQWINIDSDFGFRFDASVIDFEKKGEDLKVVTSTPIVELVNDGSSLTLEEFTFTQKVQPRSDDALVIDFSANKLKSKNLFVRKPTFYITATAAEATVSTLVGLEANLVSYKGNPVENFKIQGVHKSANYKDPVEMWELLNRSCFGRIMEEEQKVDMRLLATKIIDDGFYVAFDTLGWVGPRGETSGKGRLEIKKVIDPQTGLPDFYSGFLFNVNLKANELYEQMPWFVPLNEMGLLRKGEGKVNMTVSFKDKQLFMNGERVSEKKQQQIENNINQFASGLFPTVENTIQLRGFN